ncbi:MAG: DUF559 domain-containing protein [Paludibacteraceae bacterium]|nr:DUF559 domain-containing protein [Paludibacteraceae bacterium]MBR6286935.1 DUF559 domain-containing protein [Bacteroidaceae bacterium]
MKNSRVRNCKEMLAVRRMLRNNQTPAERMMWKVLKNKQILGIQFRRQFSVDGYILDFFAPSVNLCIELDGDFHYTESGAIHDIARDAFLVSKGITVLRIENKDLWNDPDNIRDYIEQRVLKLREEE